MGVRQYIGARYVTKIYENSLDPSSAEWEAGVTYEPLTLVTYLNSSYLSKKEVPGSIGDPATNPSYWVVTGAYNGQIAQLQNDIQNLESQINTKSNLTNKNILIIMDSYGSRVDSNGDNVAEAIEAKTGATCHLEYQNGASLRGNTFTALLTGYAGNVDEIDTIILICGANDQVPIESGLISDVKDGGNLFVSTARSTFPNLDDIIFMCPGLTFSTTQSPPVSVKSREVLWNTIRDIALENSCVYVDNSQYILRNTALLANDFCHPNAYGIDEIVNYTIQALMTGVIDVHYRLECVYTRTDSSTTNYVMNRDNAIVSITSTGGVGSSINAVNVTDITGGSRNTYGSFNESLVDNPELYGSNDAGGLALYSYNSAQYYCRMEIQVKDKTVIGFATRVSSSNPNNADVMSLLHNPVILHN